MPNFISEDQIEQVLVQRLQHLYGFDSLNCYTDDPEDLNDGSHRASKRDVILMDRVKDAALRLNPDIPPKVIDEALEKLVDRRRAMSLIAANREVYNLLRDGITDRDDLDGQIYRNFLHTGTVTEAEAAQPKDSEEMRKFLGQNKRLVFMADFTERTHPITTKGPT